MECFTHRIDPGCYYPAKEFAIGADDIDRRRRAEAADDARCTVLLDGGERIDETVRSK
jgi:hypothetical protein